MIPIALRKTAAGRSDRSSKLAFTEDEVIQIVCERLQADGFIIISRCTTKQKGIDIIADNRIGTMWHIEAKGGRSGREGSNRHGMNFTAVQTIDRVMKGFFAAAAMAEATRRNSARIGLAIPRSSVAEAYMGKVRAALETLGIAIWWIEPGGSVSIEEPHA